MSLIARMAAPSDGSSGRRIRLLAGLGLMAALLAGCAAPRVAQTPVEPAPAVVDSSPKRPPRIGLALGGGAAKGFAHVGVIAVL